MNLELIRDEARVFPDVPEPLTITSAKVWHCRYVSLAPLGSMLNLRRLEIATYPDPSLDPLTPLRLLEELHIHHMPGIRELWPLASLENLRVLTLQTTPGWDPSGKVTDVLSLAPLAALPRLEELELHGVVPRGRTATDLFESRSLRRVRLSKFRRGEEEKVAAWLAGRG
jgi:hypothetical protein